MKKMLVVLALLAAPSPAYAQVVQILNPFSVRGVPVKVVNATEDGKAVEVQFGADAHVFLPPNGFAVAKAGGGVLQVPQSMDFAIAALVCDSVVEASRFPVPAWARDPNLAGPSYVHDSWIVANNPGEDELKARVEAIKKYLDERKALGRGRMKDELGDWFKRVRKNGYDFVRRCDGGIEAQSLRIGVYSGYSNQQQTQITVFVRGKDGRYFIAQQ